MKNEIQDNKLNKFRLSAFPVVITVSISEIGRRDRSICKRTACKCLCHSSPYCYENATNRLYFQMLRSSAQRNRGTQRPSILGTLSGIITLVRLVIPPKALLAIMRVPGAIRYSPINFFGKQKKRAFNRRHALH